MTTTTWLGILAAVIAACSYGAARLSERSYKRGFSGGHESGYERGRKDADSWWIGGEAEVDRARREIWREQ